MSAANYYKVSYVVEDSVHRGAIINMDHEPAIGEEVRFDGAVFVILEVEELMPPIHDFGFLHVTCRYVRDVD